jgi:hypothetical protein
MKFEELDYLNNAMLSPLKVLNLASGCRYRLRKLCEERVK